MKHTDINLTVQGLLPYTERHFQRLSRLQQLSTFVEYTWECMKLPNVTSSLTVLEKRNDSRDLPVSSSSMDSDKNDLVTEVDGVKSLSVVEERIDSSCTVDNEIDSPHVTTDGTTDGVTLAAADSTTPEVVDTHCEKIKSSLKRRGTQSERKKLKQKKLTPTTQKISSGFNKLKRTPLRRTRMSLSLTSSF